jgi:trehalose 6-phosphate phosphatase
VAPGRYVLELRPPGTDKGVALRALVAEAGARSVVFLGDDLGDLPAVAALRELDVAGLVVCSDSDETPDVLRLEADLVVDGPPGVIAFLDALATALSA